MRDPRARLKEFSFIAAVGVLAKLRSIILVPLMIRAFGLADYGNWVQVIASTSLLCGITQANLHTTLLRYIPSADARRRAEVFYNGFFWVLGVAAVAAVLVMLVLTGLAAKYLELPPRLVFLLGPLIFVRGLYQFVNNVSRADGHIRFYTLLDAAPAVTEISAIVIGAVFHAKLEVCLTAMVALEGALLVALSATIMRRMTFIWPTWTALRPLLAYALPGIPTNVGTFLLNSADRYLIGGTLGSEAVGVYSAAYALASLPSFFVRPLIIGLLPRAAKAWDAGDKAGAMKMLRRSIKAYTFIGVPSAVGLAVVGPDILALSAGASRPEWTVWLLLSIGGGTWFLALVQLGIHSYLLEERVGATAWLYIGASVVNIALNAALLVPLGLIAAGLATTVAYAAACIPVQLNALRRIGPVFDVRSTVVAFASAGGMAAVVWFLRGPTVLRVAVAVAAGAVIYPAAAWILRYFDAEERAYIGALVRRGPPKKPPVESAPTPP
ncbi:MAG: oligosaccharide flippase family protein [Polyangiaceae bacterium]